MKNIDVKNLDNFGQIMNHVTALIYNKFWNPDRTFLLRLFWIICMVIGLVIYATVYNIVTEMVN